MASTVALPFKPKKALRDVGKLAGVLALLYLLPVFTLFYICCGAIDFARNRTLGYAAINRYFFGNGLLTWVISPFNLFVDLLCKHNPGIYRMEDLAPACAAELRGVIDELKANKEGIAAAFRERLDTSRRGMIFFRWYDRHIGGPLALDFPNRLVYVKTIGVSCFNRQEATSFHFGPTRVTFRVLYNLDPSDSEGVYIQVGDRFHYWRDDPLFIFDDTLMHRSVNLSDDLRYCAFIDVLRPSRFRPVLQALLTGMQVVFLGINRLFYRNWKMIR